MNTTQIHWHREAPGLQTATLTDGRHVRVFTNCDCSRRDCPRWAYSIEQDGWEIDRMEMLDSMREAKALAISNL